MARGDWSVHVCVRAGYRCMRASVPPAWHTCASPWCLRSLRPTPRACVPLANSCLMLALGLPPHACVPLACCLMHACPWPAAPFTCALGLMPHARVLFVYAACAPFVYSWVHCSYLPPCCSKITCVPLPNAPCMSARPLRTFPRSALTQCPMHVRQAATHVPTECPYLMPHAYPPGRYARSH